MAYPKDYKYTKEHEWIKVEGKTGTVGITDYAQNSLGDIVYVDAPKVGEAVTAHATFGSVESVKAVSDLYSPVNGEIIAINEKLINDPTIISGDPYGKGWMIKIKIEPGQTLDGLLTLEQYEKQIASEEH